MAGRDPLVDLLDEARAEAAGTARSRQRWLEQQAAEGATLVGTLVGLAERGGPVALRTRAGRVCHGPLVAVGGDFVVVRADAGRDHCVRIGAIASSLTGDENEVVVFNATSNKPQVPQDILQRIQLGKGEEANDLDIFDKGDGQFELAYVLDYDVVVHNISTTQSKPKDARRKIYSIPMPYLGKKTGRSKLRCIRWLTPEHLLLLVNKPNRTGVELLLVHMYEEGPGSVVLRKALPKRVKAATDMDVAFLDSNSSGAYQIAIAIAAIDISLHVYSMDYHGRSKNSLSSFHHFATYDDVSVPNPKYPNAH